MRILLSWELGRYLGYLAHLLRVSPAAKVQKPHNRRRHGARIVILSTLTAVLNVSFSDESFVVSSSSFANQNVVSGDPDYPSLNPHPARLLTVHLSAPNTLRISLYAAFVSDGNAQSRAHYCAFRPNQEAIEPYSVLELVDSPRGAPGGEVQLAIDKYLPGPCSWHLSGIKYVVANGDKDRGSDWIARMYEDARDRLRREKLTRGPAYVVCERDPYAAEALHNERCGPLGILQQTSPIRTDVTSRLPEAFRNGRDALWIFSDTKEIELHFFDLDTLIPDTRPRAKVETRGTESEQPAELVKGSGLNNWQSKQKLATKTAYPKEPLTISAIELSADRSEIAVYLDYAECVEVGRWRGGGHSLTTLRDPSHACEWILPYGVFHDARLSGL